MQVIPAVAVEAIACRRRARDRGAEIGGKGGICFIPAPEPGEFSFGAHRLLATVFGPLDGAGLGAQDPSAGLASFA